MFKHNIEHSRSTKLSPFGHGYQRNQGYQNIDSPMRAAFRQQAQSPKYNLSPMKMNRDTGRLNRSRSPILLSKRDDNNFMSGNKQLSPFRRMDYRQTNFNNQDRQSVFYNNQQHQDQSFQNVPKNMSFTNLIRKNSNTCNSPHNYPLISPIEHSTSTVNYLQSDRNFREDTNLFKKLATMLESNKSNQNQNKSFVNSAISQNSVNYKTLPQSCKNATSNHGSNKKVMFKNVLTIESIQSPEDYRNEGKKYEDGIETRCYSQYEKMTTQYPLMEKKQSNRKDEPKLQKIFSQRINAAKDDEPLFKKVSLGNQNTMQQQAHSKPIDFHLTNSFGAAALKNQMITESKKQAINPFEEIISEIQPPQQFESQHSITKSLSQSQDSVFASLHMLLQKVDDKQSNNSSPKQNESINLSILSQNSMGELDMEPFIERRG